MAHGIGGLDYEITQISVVVRDIKATIRQYTELLGWGPWNVYEHKPPLLHDCTLRGKPVEYTLLGAEVFVGSSGMNFELLEPVEGPSLWHEFLDEHGEGIYSIATMFKTEEESEAVKAAFAEKGASVVMSGQIGDHIEFYYLDTQPLLKISLESGSGHAIDFVKPVWTHP
jgi:catechol 2,3-dioxygenase-like lactoylglutathione lyase family enzyme